MEPELNTKVSISILTYNRSSILKTLILSLQEIQYSSMEIIVVDNHSNDGTQEMINTDFPHIKYIRTNKNLGASARNLGMKSANGSIIVTLDDDIIGIQDKDIINLIKHFNDRPKLGAINFKVLDHTTMSVCNWVHHCKEEEYSDREFDTYEITEGAVAFRKEALKNAGYYSEEFFLSYEGPDLAIRIINSGYGIIYFNKISVVHFHSDSGRKPWLNYYFDTRNQLWLAIRNFPVPYSIIFLTRGILSMFVYSIRDGYLFVWCRAILDSLKGVKTALAARNVLNPNSMRIIRRIDKNRPSFVYSAKKRFLKKGVRL